MDAGGAKGDVGGAGGGDVGAGKIIISGCGAGGSGKVITIGGDGSTTTGGTGSAGFSFTVKLASADQAPATGLIFQ